MRPLLYQQKHNLIMQHSTWRDRIIRNFRRETRPRESLLRVAEPLSLKRNLYETQDQIFQILRKFEKTAGAAILPPGTDVFDYENFHASVDIVRSQRNITFIEVRFGHASKLVIFQDHHDDMLGDCVVFERYCNGKMDFRSTCAVTLDDRRLSDLELLCVGWTLHHNYLVERGKLISESYALQRQCKFRY
jgi:hypothetical protein